MGFKRSSIDTSKHVFMLHGIDERDSVVLRRELRRGQVEPFFAREAPAEVAASEDELRERGVERIVQDRADAAHHFDRAPFEDAGGKQSL